jgi:ribosomal protein S18 acetylase RimI-like enzyme
MSGGAELCEELPWDSAFFGRSIARALESHLDESSCRAMLEWCVSRRIECLYFLCSLDDSATQHLVNEHGFQSVGVRVTLVRPPGSDVAGDSARFRAATAEDIPRLRAIALTSHRDTRFHADGHFDPARCDELYATWIEKSVHGYATHVIVAEREGAAIGYVTLHVDEEAPALSEPRRVEGASRTGRIGLFAVDEQWRGRGIGRDLLRQAAHLLREEGVRETSVVTPGRNTGALALYKNAGFRTTDVSLWYHRWFSSQTR